MTSKSQASFTNGTGHVEAGLVVSIRRGVRVLALGPHVSDIEIGCGGTLLRFKEEFDATIHTAIFSNHRRYPSHIDRVKEAEVARDLFRYDEQVIFQHEDKRFVPRAL